MEYVDVFTGTLVGTMNWVWQLITFSTDWDQNYFYGLIIVSLLVWGLEIMFPWRRSQSLIRKDFWLDGFYMFFNFFIFSIVISGFYAVIEKAFGGAGITMDSIALLPKDSIPLWAFILLFFIHKRFCAMVYTCYVA